MDSTQNFEHHPTLDEINAFCVWLEDSQRREHDAGLELRMVETRRLCQAAVREHHARRHVRRARRDFFGLWQLCFLAGVLWVVCGIALGYVLFS